MSIYGRLVRVSPDKPNLLCFVAVKEGEQLCSNALVLIGGLGDGFMGLAYTEALSRGLPSVDYNLVMVNLSSSWFQFGFQTLVDDCRELEIHVDFLKKQFNFNRIVLLGHSTGAQGALYFMRHGRQSVTDLVNGVILQGGVSDRDGMMDEPHADQTARMKDEAEKLTSNGKEDAILSEKIYGGHITAKRLLSLAGRLTDDDMFSTDLTEDELDPILCSVKVPILLCYSEQDEHVPDQAALREVAQRMLNVLGRYTSRAECQYYEGNHALSEPKFFEPFVKDVVKFASSI